VLGEKFDDNAVKQPGLSKARTGRVRRGPKEEYYAVEDRRFLGEKSFTRSMNGNSAIG
jgi:hypothetical protein